MITRIGDPHARSRNRIEELRPAPALKVVIDTLIEHTLHIDRCVLALYATKMELV